MKVCTRINWQFAQTFASYEGASGLHCERDKYDDNFSSDINTHRVEIPHISIALNININILR